MHHVDRYYMEDSGVSSPQCESVSSYTGTDFLDPAGDETNSDKNDDDHDDISEQEVEAADYIEAYSRAGGLCLISSPTGAAAILLMIRWLNTPHLANNSIERNDGSNRKFRRVSEDIPAPPPPPAE